MREIKVYDAQDYELLQTIATGGGEVRKIAPTPNSQMFTAGKSNGLVQVYKHDGNQYERVQEFDAGMYIYSLLLNSERLIASGSSSGIRIYGSSGADYALQQVIQTNEPQIYDIHQSSEFTQLLFGGSSGFVSIYQAFNDSYSLVEEIMVDKTILEVYTDQQELYLMIETVDGMLTYYKCPP